MDRRRFLQLSVACGVAPVLVASTCAVQADPPSEPEPKPEPDCPCDPQRVAENIMKAAEQLDANPVKSTMLYLSDWNLVATRTPAGGWILINPNKVM